MSLLFSLCVSLSVSLSLYLSLSLDLYIYLFPTKKKTRGYFLLSGSLCASGCSDFSVSLFICASRSAVFLFIHLLPARKRGWQRISESCDGSVDLNPQQAPLLSVKKKRKKLRHPSIDGDGDCIAPMLCESSVCVSAIWVGYPLVMWG